MTIDRSGSSWQEPQSRGKFGSKAPHQRMCLTRPNCLDFGALSLSGGDMSDSRTILAEVRGFTPVIDVVVGDVGLVAAAV